MDKIERNRANVARFRERHRAEIEAARWVGNAVQFLGVNRGPKGWSLRHRVEKVAEALRYALTEEELVELDSQLTAIVWARKPE